MGASVTGNISSSAPRASPKASRAVVVRTGRNENSWYGLVFPHGVCDCFDEKRRGKIHCLSIVIVCGAIEGPLAGKRWEQTTQMFEAVPSKKNGPRATGLLVVP
ncbi:hypothetical protein [Pseudorhodoplanes sp.]|uniref:hypothetical protein n=1 Tax=Pseudorhodoplanes sp. TaxID=1934341 RepID=UPI00391BDFCD